MKFKFPLVAAFVAILSLAACGGGSSSGGSNTQVSDAPALKKTDTVVGTGAEATAGKKVYFNYTGWLYSATAADHKGAQFEQNAWSFTLGTNAAIAGFDQGIVGMKVGGKRTIEIPSSLAYGATGNGSIPPNSGLVFDIELTKVE
jgi:FKBP-type peptidyl-prolyl cis-trans isomerase FkpA